MVHRSPIRLPNWLLGTESFASERPSGHGGAQSCTSATPSPRSTREWRPAPAALELEDGPRAAGASGRGGDLRGRGAIAGCCAQRLGVHGRANARIAICPLVAAPSEQANPAALLADDQAVAIMLDFVNPLRSDRRLGGEGRDARLNDAGPLRLRSKLALLLKKRKQGDFPRKQGRRLSTNRAITERD